jgi:hypothetical protein
MGRNKFARLLSLIVIACTALSCQSSSPPETADIGMTVHSRGADAANIDRQFELMAQMGVKWVRVDVPWAWTESEQGTLDWGYPDKIVDEAKAHGMNVLAVFSSTPGWALAAGSGDPYSRPADLASYANFAKVAVQRYASRGVDSWEVWNEPNIAQFWPPTPDADEYGRLFRAVADAIRSVDPKATILLAGLSPKYDSPDSEISPIDFLEQLYANGSAQLADAVAAHPYTFPALPMAKQQRMVGGFKDLPLLRNVMTKHGDGGKKIWITEFGAPTGNSPNAVSEGGQARTLVEARRQAARWDWVGPLIYYELVDGGTDPNDDQYNFGVLREDLSPKLAAIALIKSASR